MGVLDVHEAGCQAVVDTIVAGGGQAAVFGVDLRWPAQVEQAVTRFVDTFGPPNVLINNAAVMPSGSLHQTSMEEFDWATAVNLRGTFLISKTVLPYMMEQRQGSIVNMGSVAGMVGAPGMAIYSMTKTAIIGLTRNMAIDYAPYGIRVNAVSPGTVDSPMLHKFIETQSNPAAIRQAFDDVHPLGRVGKIEDVANVYVFLASDESSFVTGANYTVDGGLSIKGDQPQD